MTNPAAEPPPNEDSPAPEIENTNPLRLPYELRIGVTGHCGVDETDELRAAVGNLIDDHILAVLEGACVDPKGPHGSARGPTDFFHDFVMWTLSITSRFLSSALRALTFGYISFPAVPHGPRCPAEDRHTQLDLTVVSCLAPGADLLVAEEVVKRVRRLEHRNRVVEAVLPFPVEDYKQEFSTAESLARFDKLLTLDRGKTHESNEPTIVHAQRGSNPGPAFVAASRQMVDASELVIAVYDPTREVREGGAAETVRYAVERGRVVLWLDPSHLARGVRCLVPASKGSLPGPFGLSVTHPPTRSKALSFGFHRLAAYNRDAASDSRECDAIFADEERRLRVAAKDRLPAEVVDAIVSDLLPHYAHADQLAVRYAALRKFVTILLPVISATALTFIAIQILFMPEFYSLAIVEILILALGYLSYRLSVREAWHEKWLNDRHLAEHLRALLYNGVLEVYKPSGGINTHALPFYHATNAWFDGTYERVRGRFRRTLRRFNPDGHFVRIAVFIREGWIKPEREHHERVRDREGRAAQRGHALTLFALLAVTAVAIAHAIGIGHSAPSDTPPFQRIDLWVALLAIVLPAWGAAAQSVEALGDAPRLAERSALMGSLLTEIEEDLKTVDSSDDLRETLVDAQRTINLETEEWASSLRTRTSRFHG